MAARDGDRTNAGIEPDPEQSVCISRAVAAKADGGKIERGQRAGKGQVEIQLIPVFEPNVCLVPEFVPGDGPLLGHAGDHHLSRKWLEVRWRP
jgi:hypothetical protein